MPFDAGCHWRLVRQCSCTPHRNICDLSRASKGHHHPCPQPHRETTTHCSGETPKHSEISESSQADGRVGQTFLSDINSSTARSYCMVSRPYNPRRYSAKNGTGTKKACCSKMLAGPRNDVYWVKNKMNTYTSTTGIAASRASQRNTNHRGRSRRSALPIAQPVSSRAG